MNQARSFALGALGAVGGFAVGWFLGPGPPRIVEGLAPRHLPDVLAREDATRATEHLATPPREPASESVTAPTSKEGRRSATSSSEEEADADRLFSRALLEFADAGLRAGWGRRRSDVIPDAIHARGMAEFRELVQAAPAQIGYELAGRQTAKEEALRDSELGGAITLLERMDATPTGPLPELVGDAEAFGALFQSSHNERALNGVTRLAAGEGELEDGDTLTFPAGVFEIPPFLARESAAEDVTLSGAGMNSTLLVLRQDLSTRSILRNFRIRDCTLLLSGSLFDLRHRPATMYIDRTRLLGFDSGAGGSSLLDAPQLALFARNSVFAGGYGRSPGGAAQLFDVRSDGLLARFEACRIVQVNLNTARLRPSNTLLFLNCSFEEILDGPPQERPGSSYPGCTFTYSETQDRNALRRDLNELFPDWQQRLERVR